MPYCDDCGDYKKKVVQVDHDVRVCEDCVEDSETLQPEPA